RQPDGSSSQPLGRFSDWLFPPGSFGEEPGTLDGTPVLAMSVSGMLAMKEQFPRLRNGRPWRQKDIDDIEILRALAAGRGRSTAPERQDRRAISVPLPPCGSQVRSPGRGGGRGSHASVSDLGSSPVP